MKPNEISVDKGRPSSDEQKLLELATQIAANTRSGLDAEQRIAELWRALENDNPRGQRIPSRHDLAIALRCCVTELQNISRHEQRRRAAAEQGAWLLINLGYMNDDWNPTEPHGT